MPRRVAERHLRLLVALGPLRTSRPRRRTYYRRDEVRIAEVARMFEKGWWRSAPGPRTAPEVTRTGPRR